MANYRQIHVSIWKDEWFLELEPQEKLLFIYLFSNEATSLAGIYKLPVKVIVFETGLDRQFIEDTLDKFSKVRKVFYENGIVWVVNMRTYHETKSIKVQTRILTDIARIPECQLKIRYLYSMDTRPQLKEEEDKEEEEDKGAVVFRAYEQNIGALTPHVAEKINANLQDIPPEWIIKAIQVAVENNARRWAYISAILDRWRIEGIDAGRPSKDKKPSLIEGLKYAGAEPNPS